MSEYNISKPCWTWANADGAVDAGNTVTGEVRPSPDKRYDSPLLNKRETTHGDWRHTAAVAQHIKSNWRGHKGLTDSQRESLDMIATKIARIVCGNPDELDHWKDLAGYATLVVENLKT